MQPCLSACSLHKPLLEDVCALFNEIQCYVVYFVVPAKRELLKDSLKSFPPLRDPNSESPLEPEDYVGIMHDVLSLGKNLILTRNLNKLPYQLLDGV